MSYLNADPNKPTQELLSDIRAAAQQSHVPGLPLLPLANLLVKLGTEGSEAIDGLKAHITDLNEKNAKLQWWVVALAIAALLSTLIQTVFSIAAYISPPSIVHYSLMQPQQVAAPLNAPKLPATASSIPLPVLPNSVVK